MLAIAPDSLPLFRDDLRARALPVRRRRRGDRRPAPRGARSALRQQAGGHGPAGAARQAAADDARRRAAARQPLAPFARRDRPGRRRRSACCARRPSPTRRSSITIGDRTVGGLCSRDQMVGPWQVPVADCATTLLGFRELRRRGVLDRRAHAAGRRSTAPASGRMAVAEALTNLAAAPVRDLSLVKLSANWMAAAGVPGEDAALFDTVRAVALDLCPQLGISIPVGQGLDVDAHGVGGRRRAARQVVGPLSLIVSAFAPCDDVRGHADAAAPDRRRRRPCSCWPTSRPAARAWAARCWPRSSARPGDETPDVDDPAALRGAVRGDGGAAARRPACSPITIGRTAACS